MNINGAGIISHKYHESTIIFMSPKNITYRGSEAIFYSVRTPGGMYVLDKTRGKRRFKSVKSIFIYINKKILCKVIKNRLKGVA